MTDVYLAVSEKFIYIYIEKEIEWCWSVRRDDFQAERERERRRRYSGLNELVGPIFSLSLSLGFNQC